MGETLQEVRRKIKLTKSSISSKNISIDSKKKRKDVLNDIVKKFYTVDNCIHEYNSSLKALMSNINDSIISNGKFDNYTILDSKIEKESDEDKKLSAAIEKLKTEISNIENDIETINSENTSLNETLKILKENEKKLIAASISGGR